MSDDEFIIGAKKKPQNQKDQDKHNQAECQESFKKAFFAEEKINKAKLLEVCMSGDIEEKMIRPTVWKLLLGIIPFEKPIAEWIKIVTKQRSEWKNKVKNLNTLKKFAGDPLGGNTDSGWNSFFEDNELKKIINLDINRTYQDKDLFQNTVIKEILVNILFIWSKENRDTSYRQGMNEILAVLLFALYPFYFKLDSKLLKSQDALNTLNANLLTLNLSNIEKENQEKYKEIYNFMNDQDEISADLYYLFDAIMAKGVKDLFDTGNPNSKKKDPVSYKKYELFQQQWTEGEEILNEVDQLPLHRRCHLIIKEKLKIIDEELYNHFIKIDLNCAIFLQRWLKCIFNREFHPKDVIVLWDTILANDIVDSSQSTDSYNLIFIDFLAVAMISYIREDLLRKDQNECFQRLFKYPPIETPMILVKLALQIKEQLYKRRKKMLEKKKLNESAPSNNNLSNSNKSSKSPMPANDLQVNKLNLNANASSSFKSPNSGKPVGIGSNALLSSSSSSGNNNSSSGSNAFKISTVLNSNPNNSINETKENKNSEQIHIPPAEEEDFRPQLIEKLQFILNKYEKHFETVDKEDFQNIVETLKNNLIDD